MKKMCILFALSILCCFSYGCKAQPTNGTTRVMQAEGGSPMQSGKMKGKAKDGKYKSKMKHSLQLPEEVAKNSICVINNSNQNTIIILTAEIGEDKKGFKSYVLNFRTKDCIRLPESIQSPVIFSISSSNNNNFTPTRCKLERGFYYQIFIEGSNKLAVARVPPKPESGRM